MENVNNHCLRIFDELNVAAAVCVCLFVVICSVSNVGILCVFFSSLVGLFGCGTTWIWCWNLLPFDQRFFISRQLVTFYLHFFANFARRFGSHMVHFSHLCQIWRSSAPRFCFPCGDFEMRMSISIYTIVITFTDLNRVITMITWHLKKEFFLSFVLPQIKWIFHALHLSMVPHRFGLQFGEFPLTLTLQASHYVLSFLIHNTCVKLSHDAKPKGQINIDKWRGMKNCLTCCKCLDDHHDLFEYDKNDPSKQQQQNTRREKKKYLSSKYYVVFNMKLVWQNIHLFICCSLVWLMCKLFYPYFVDPSISLLCTLFASLFRCTHNTWYSFVPSKDRQTLSVTDRERRQAKRVQA